VFWSLPNDSNVFVIGDSVNGQIFDGFSCDVIRRNHPMFHSKSHIEYHRVSEDDATEQMSRRIPNWESLASAPGTQERSGTRYESHIRSESLIAHRNGETKVVHMNRLSSPRAYLPLFRDPSFCEWGSVYLMNWDLHYGAVDDASWDREIGGEIFQILQKCMDKWEPLEKGPIFIWYEGTPQHYAGTVGGYWSDIYGRNQTLSRQHREQVAQEQGDPDLLINAYGHCGPHHYFRDKCREKHVQRQRVINHIDQNPNLTFNLEIVYPDQMIQRSREQTLYFIPLKDALDSLWNMHPSQGSDTSGQDCTHWCSAPYLWELVWDSMARIIEKNKN